jgi:hypothetical protein
MQHTMIILFPKILGTIAALSFDWIWIPAKAAASKTNPTSVPITSDDPQPRVVPPHCKARRRHVRLPKTVAVPGRSNCRTFSRSGAGAGTPEVFRNIRISARDVPPIGRLK